MNNKVRFWKTKTFKTRALMDAWVEKNKHKYQMSEVFINNGFGMDYKPLLKINV